MLKKIAMAAAFAATAAFATWDYYPIQDAGKGSARAGLYYDKHHKWSQAGLDLGARFTVVKNLEIAVSSWGYQFWSEEDCGNCTNGGDGLRDMTIGGRYQLNPMVNAFLDLNLPIGNEDDGKNGHPPSSGELSIYAGAQLSMPIQGTPGLAFGTEAGFLWGFEHDNNERGIEIHFAGEMGYTIPNTVVTPYLGLQMKLKFTEDTWEEEDGTEHGKDNSGKTQFNLWLGCKAALNPMITIDGRFIFRSGNHDRDHMGGDATGLYMGASINF